MFALALGATAGRLSDVVGASGSSEKPVELVRRVPAAGEPSVVPFGPLIRIVCPAGCGWKPGALAAAIASISV
jgi:hypothetical protein